MEQRKGPNRTKSQSWGKYRHYDDSWDWMSPVKDKYQTL